MTALDVVSSLGTVLFFAVTVLAAVDWRRRRTYAAGAIAIAFALLTVLRTPFVADALLLGPRVAGAVTVVALAGAGYAMLEYRAALFGLAAGWRVAAAVALAVPAAALLLSGIRVGEVAPVPPLQTVAAAAFVVAWAACVTEPALRLWRASRTVAAVQRTQMRLMAGAFLGMALVLLALLLIGADGAAPPVFQFAAETAGAMIAVTLYASLKPPAPLRRRWLRRHTEALVQQLHPVAAWYFDLTTQTTWWSPTLRKLMGVGADEPLDDPRYADLVHPEDQPRVSAEVDGVLRDHRAVEQQYRVVRPGDGAVLWVRVTCDVLLDLERRKPTALFGTMHDVTPFKLAELQLEQALEKERQAAAELRRLDELKSTFLSAVSHELRTPLTALKGFGVTLQARAATLDTDQRAELTARIVENADRLERLLGDLLDLNRLSREVVEPDLQPVEVTHLVREAAEAVDHGGRLRPMDLPRDGLIAVLDAAKVDRIVSNLVRNAVDHTPPEASVWVRVSADAGDVVIVVEDDGPGVPDEVKTAIFEHFRQGLRPPSRGTGVGLAIVSQFAALHGGRAWVLDRPGGGASFHVRLPGGSPVEVGQVAQKAPASG